MASLQLIIIEYMNYVRRNENSTYVYEGEEVVNFGHISNFIWKNEQVPKIHHLMKYMAH